MPHLSETIYLDNAATTFPKPTTVVEATTKCMTQEAVNSGRGIYALARRADQLIASTREQTKVLLGFREGQLIFCHSATQALNQILLGLDWKRGDIVYITPFEHNSVARILEYLALTTGLILKQLPVSIETMTYQLDMVQEIFFQAPPKGVVMTHASNVCGLITPIAEIATLAKIYDATVVVDGAQGGPLLAGYDNGALDFYVFSGHKTFYGPFGIAGFWTNERILLKPILFGGTGNKSEELSMPEGLPQRYESGSHNIVAIAGLKAACQWLMDVGSKKILEHERLLVDRLINGLEEIEGVKWYLNSDLQNQVGIVSIVLDSYTSQDAAMVLDQSYHMAVRSGLHCAPLAHKFLNTLPHGTLRISFGYYNTVEEVDMVIQAIKDIVYDN